MDTWTPRGAGEEENARSAGSRGRVSAAARPSRRSGRPAPQVFLSPPLGSPREVAARVALWTLLKGTGCGAGLIQLQPPLRLNPR
jgi:hypothetical protein